MRIDFYHLYLPVDRIEDRPLYLGALRMLIQISIGCLSLLREDDSDYLQISNPFDIAFLRLGFGLNIHDMPSIEKAILLLSSRYLRMVLSLL